jgi:hypothetical protein
MGIAAVRLVVRSSWLKVIDYVCLYERDSGDWQWVGGGRSARKREWTAADRPKSILVYEGGSATRSYIDRSTKNALNTAHAEAGWVACAMFHVAASVAHLEVRGRRTMVPRHGHAVIAWKGPPSSEPSRRPCVVAVGENGMHIAKFGPSDSFDSVDDLIIAQMTEKSE